MTFETILFIGAPAAQVWDALVNPEIVGKYFLCPLSEIDLQTDGTISYGEGMISGKIAECEEDNTLVHSFAFAHHPDEPASTVRYNLRAMGDVTELTLTHGDFADDSKTLSDIRSGWPTILSDLKTRLETGKGLPWPKAAESAE